MKDRLCWYSAVKQILVQAKLTKTARYVAEDRRKAVK